MTKTKKRKGVGSAPARRKTASKGAGSLIIGIVGGAIVAKAVPKLISRVAPTLPPIVSALVPVAVGVVLTTQKSDMLKGAGYGMVGVGAGNLAEALVPGLAAPEDTDVLFLGEMEEEQALLMEPADMSVLSEPADMSVLSGTEEDTEEMMLNGFEEEFDEM